MASHSVPFPYLSLCIDQSTTINVSDNWKVTSYGIKSSVKYVFLPLSHFLVWNVRFSTPGRIKKNICNTAVKILSICVIIWLHLLILLNSWLLCNEAKIDILSALEMLRTAPLICVWNIMSWMDPRKYVSKKNILKEHRRGNSITLEFLWIHFFPLICLNSLFYSVNWAWIQVLNQIPCLWFVIHHISVVPSRNTCDGTLNFSFLRYFSIKTWALYFLQYTDKKVWRQPK